jgi:hypothetical protein
MFFFEARFMFWSSEVIVIPRKLGFYKLLLRVMASELALLEA